MVALDADVKQRALQAAAILARSADVRAAYVFGSQVEGRADQWSDIDVALFMEGAENWDITRRVEVMGEIQNEAGNDVEAHFFSAKSLTHPERGSFAEYILKNGVRVLPPAETEP